jgi:hypothetical protein
MFVCTKRLSAASFHASLFFPSRFLSVEGCFDWLRLGGKPCVCAGMYRVSPHVLHFTYVLSCPLTESGIAWRCWNGVTGKRRPQQPRDLLFLLHHNLLRAHSIKLSHPLSHSFAQTSLHHPTYNSPVHTTLPPATATTQSTSLISSSALHPHPSIHRTRTLIDKPSLPTMVKQFGNVYLIAAIAIIGGGLFGFDISSMSAM